MITCVLALQGKLLPDVAFHVCTVIIPYSSCTLGEKINLSPPREAKDAAKYFRVTEHQRLHEMTD